MNNIDEIGPWSEIKLEIIRKYAAAYSTILSNQKYLHHVYIDAFAGLGYRKSKTTQEVVKGSPRLAVEIKPPFEKCYDYTNDELGRRTSRADSGSAFEAQQAYGDPATVEMPAYNAYSYNSRSEVTGAARRWGTPDASGDLVLGQQYAYAFDAIGNRITAAEGDTSRTASYTANALNQYTQRTVPDEKDLIGAAPTDVTVTVNQNQVTRQNAYWHHALEVDKDTVAAYPEVEIAAVHSNLYSAVTGRVFVAQTPESFTYDDDGNLTQDGRFDYTWNGENRLIKAETRDDLPVAMPHVKVEYAYDHQGRMVWKQISTNAVVVSTRTLLWDGYNIVSTTIQHSSFTNHHFFTWGLDLSGSMQGAGGIGGLLAVIHDDDVYHPSFDANGNITEYLSTDGTIAAHYEYSPFGEIVVQSSDLADSFTHRFSTKPWCSATELSEYEKRKYGPGMGRWLSRDPIKERGGVNVYGFVRNHSVLAVDIDGRLEFGWTPVPRDNWDEPWVPDYPDDDDSSHWHRDRNQGNRCPQDRPGDSCLEQGDQCQDGSGNTWNYEGRPGLHGNQDCFRGTGAMRSSQCCYDNDGNLDNEGSDQGTRDYFPPYDDDGSVDWGNLPGHVICDVIPHFCDDNYSPTPPGGIY